MYAHTLDGAVESRTCGAQVWLYEYDAVGTLREVTLPSGSTIRYEYDARGRPVSRYEDEVFDKGWLWGSQLEPVAEVDVDGVLTARYVYGSRAHVPDYVVKGGATYKLVSDYRGSVRAVVDVDSQVLAQRIEYGRWGEVVSEVGAGFQSFGYAGGIWDADTGLVLFGARWYDAGTGRWMSRDPALFGGGQANLYVYARNAPVGMIDKTGLRPDTPYRSLLDALLFDLSNELVQTIESPWQPYSVTNREYGSEIYVMNWGAVCLMGACHFGPLISHIPQFKPT